MIDWIGNIAIVLQTDMDWMSNDFILKKFVNVLPKNLSELCQKSVEKICQNSVAIFFAKISTKALLTFYAAKSKKGQPNAEKPEKRDKKSRKKYWRVFCIPRPDATKSHLVIRLTPVMFLEFAGAKLQKVHHIGSTYYYIIVYYVRHMLLYSAR
jgi:hypothetical protein